MDEIKRNVTDWTGERKTRTYPVYTKGEADELGIKYCYYKDVTEAQQWCISDDDYVAQVIRINGPYTWRGREKSEIILPYCRVWSTGSSRHLSYIKFREAGIYSHHSPTKSHEYSLRGSAFKRALKKYAFLYISQRGVLSEDQLIEVGNEYRSDQLKPQATFLRALRTQTGKRMLKNELKELLEEFGVTPQHVVQQQQRIIDDALSSGQLSVAEKANSKFIEMLDMTPDKITVTEKLEGGTIRFDHLISRTEETKQIKQ